MLNKKGITYRKIFFELKQIANERQKQFSPTLIVTDFESGVLPVVKTEVGSLCLGNNTVSLHDLSIYLVFLSQELWVLFSLHPISVQQDKAIGSAKRIFQQ